MKICTFDIPHLILSTVKMHEENKFAISLCIRLIKFYDEWKIDRALQNQCDTCRFTCHKLHRASFYFVILHINKMEIM